MSDHERGGPRQPLPETSDELEVELDEWDRMFDSLVLDEVPEAQSASAADDGWPDPPTAETGDALGNLVSGGSVELAGEPEALGGLLGSGAPAPAPAREVRPTRIDPDNDDSGLLTSAPRVEARPPPRRHPTIVRREDLERMREERAQAKASQAAAIPRRPEVQPADPVDVPTASVNASDLDRMVAAAEAKAGQAAAAFFEDEDDDDLYLDEFYADIEVGGERTSDPQIAPARERPPSEPVSERRVSRHVVRRETLGDRDDRPPTTPPPAAIEVTADLPDDDATSFEMAPVAPSLDATSTGDGDSGDGGIQMTADLPDDDATSFEMAPVAPSLDATSTGDGDSDDGGIHITADLPDDDATSFEMAPVAPSPDATMTGDGDSDDGGIQMTADLPDDDATSFEMAPVAPSPDATSTGGDSDGDSDDGGIQMTADLPDDDATSFEMAPVAPSSPSSPFAPSPDAFASGDADSEDLISDGVVAAPALDPFAPLADHGEALPWVAETAWVGAAPAAIAAPWVAETAWVGIALAAETAPAEVAAPWVAETAWVGTATAAVAAPAAVKTPWVAETQWQNAPLPPEEMFQPPPGESFHQPPATLRPPVFSGREPTFDAAALRLPENAAPLMGDGSDHMVRELSLYENEIELATGDDGASPLLWLEAGRLTEKLGDPGRARVLYGEALARDPDLAPATRALRRIACALGDTDTAMDHLEREIAVGDAAERRALGAYRAELLLSLGDLSAASSAISALVEEGPGDIRALMAKAELSARLGDPVMLSDTLIDLETVLADRSLAAAAFSAGGLLATVARAGTGENGQATPLAGLAADAVATAEPALAAMVELFSGQASGDPEAAEAAFARAAKLLPDSPRVLTRLAETRAQAGQPGEAANALATVLSGDGPRRERIRAGIDAGRLFITAGDADRGKDTLIATLALDPDNAALAAEIAAQVASDPAATADLLAARKSSGSVFDRIAYARALATAGDSDGASAELNAIHDPPGGAVARALDEVHVQSGMWGARSAVWEAVAMAEGTEMAWQRAARASEAWALANGDATAVSRAITAYGRVAELCPQSVEAHCALLRLASMAGPELSLQALAAAEGAAPKVIRSGTMALRRAAAALVGDDPDVATAEEVLRQALAESPRDPRPATALWVLLAGFGRMDDAAAVMIERAEQVAPSPAATRLKYRAASILLEASDETARARALFDEVVAEAPDLLPAHELRRVAYRRLGDPVPATAAQAGAGRGRDTRATAAPGDAFTSLVREAETCEDVLADRRRAAALYARALALSPGNPLAADGFVRAAEAIGDTSALAELALANLRRAEDAGDGTAKADAYEELARIDAELRGDAGSALLAFESAAASEPGRALALRAMERACAEDGRLMDLAAVYERQVAGLADSGSADRVALLLERALLGLAHNAPRAEVTAAFREALAHEPEIRLALFHLESWAREQPPSQAHLELCDAIAEHFATDSRAHAGFLTRAAEIALALGDVPGAIARYRAAVAALGSYDAALSGWQRIALLEQRWSEAADAALAHADGSVRDSERARLYHLAGVLLMERAGDPERAIAALRKALAADPAHRDAFARLRALYIAADMSVDLSHLYYHRLEVTDDDGEKLGLYHALAALHMEAFGDIDEALASYHQALTLAPEDPRALVGVADLAWKKRDFAQAADALIGRARIETDPAILAGIFLRLGEIYADHMPEPEWAKKSYHKALALDPGNAAALLRLADLGESTADYKLTLAACEQLLKLEPDAAEKISHLHRIARICGDGLGDPSRAERAYKLALDVDPTDSRALTAMITFYRDSPQALRVTLDRVALTMRERIARDATSGPAYRALSRALAAREAVGVPGSLAAARCAAELAVLFGAGEDAEHALARGVSPGKVAALAVAEADELLFPRTLPGPVRHLVAALSGRLGKVSGADIKRHRVGRNDRLGPDRDPGVAALAAKLGIEDLEVYASTAAPAKVAVEATAPVSVIVGTALLDAGDGELAFAAAGGLMLVRAGLAPLAGLDAGALALLIAGIVRQYQGSYVPPGVDEGAAEGEKRRLRKLIPNNLRHELAPYAYAIAGSRLDAPAILAGLTAASFRAGLAASGSFAAAVRVVTRARGSADFASAPELAELARFAVSEDYVALAALLASH